MYYFSVLNQLIYWRHENREVLSVRRCIAVFTFAYSRNLLTSVPLGWTSRLLGTINQSQEMRPRDPKWFVKRGQKPTSLDSALSWSLWENYQSFKHCFLMFSIWSIFSSAFEDVWYIPYPIIRILQNRCWETLGYSGPEQMSARPGCLLFFGHVHGYPDMSFVALPNDCLMELSDVPLQREPWALRESANLQTTPLPTFHFDLLLFFLTVSPINQLTPSTLPVSLSPPPTLHTAPPPRSFSGYLNNV